MQTPGKLISRNRGMQRDFAQLVLYSEVPMLCQRSSVGERRVESRTHELTWTNSPTFKRSSYRFGSQVSPCCRSRSTSLWTTSLDLTRSAKSIGESVSSEDKWWKKVDEIRICGRWQVEGLSRRSFRAVTVLEVQTTSW